MAAQSFLQIIGASPSTASSTNSTLLIIDAQNEYADGKLAVTNAASSREAIAALLQKYREAGGRVVHVVHQTPNGAPVFTPDSKLAEEFEELKPREGEKVVGKNYPSAFAETELREVLGEGGKVVLVGYMVSSSFLEDGLEDADSLFFLGTCLCFHDRTRCCALWIRCFGGRGLRGRPRYSWCIR